MIGLSLAVAAATLLVGLMLAIGASRLPTMRAQIAALALAAVVLPLGAVLAGGAVMLSTHDTAVLAALVAASLAALVGARLIGRRLIAPLDHLRDATARIAHGDLGARVPQSGPRELVELGSAFNEMAANLEELHDARAQLVAWASHDLRTPVASLQAMLEAIEDGLASPNTYIGAMHDQVRRLAAMVDDLFELARLDAGALTLDMQRTTLAPLVERSVDGVRAEARLRNVRVTGTVGADVPAVRCAPDQVRRVLDNLIANSLRHTPGAGTVAVHVTANDGGATVSVEDSGEGLTDEALAHMFDHFWRRDRARTRDDAGAGLGLAICRGLIEAQGGAIWAENRRRGGARVAFTLAAAAPDPAVSTSRTPGVDGSTQDRGRHRVTA